MAKGRGGKGKGRGKWVSSESYGAVIETIVQARNDAGLTQRTLAEALGKPPSFIAKIEQRERRVDLVEFVAIARALRIKEADLLKAVVAHLPKHLEF